MSICRTKLAYCFALSLFASSYSYANWDGDVTCPLNQRCSISVFTYDEEDNRHKGTRNFTLEAHESTRFHGADGEYARYCYAPEGNVPSHGSCDEIGVNRDER